MEEALDRNPMPPAYLPAFYATALWASRRFDEALRVADECLARAPTSGAAGRTASRRWSSRAAGEARQEAQRLLAQVPGMKAEHFASLFAARRSRAARSARGRGPRGGDPERAGIGPRIEPNAWSPTSLEWRFLRRGKWIYGRQWVVSRGQVRDQWAGRGVRLD
jgi:hypothetical protein